MTIFPFTFNDLQTVTLPPTSAQETLKGRYAYGELAATGEVVSVEFTVRDWGTAEGEADVYVSVGDEHRHECMDVPLQANISQVLCFIQSLIRDCQGLPCRWYDHYEADDDYDADGDENDSGHVLGRGTPLPVPKTIEIIGDNVRVEEGDAVVFVPFERLTTFRIAHAWRRAHQLLQAA